MNDVRFSIIIHLKNTNLELFKNAINHLSSMNYSNFEIFLFDSNDHSFIKKILNDFKDDRIKYQKLNRKFSDSEVYNKALRLISGDYCAFLRQYDFLSHNALIKIEEKCIESLIPKNKDIEFDDLRILASMHKLRQWKETAPHFIYTDYDEIIDSIRQNPHFFGAFSPELLLQKDYFKNAFFISIGLLRQIGFFNEKLQMEELYEYKIRILSKYIESKGKNRLRIVNIPGLLYHKVIDDDRKNKEEENKRLNIIYTIVKSHLKKSNIEVSFNPSKDGRYWKIKRISKIKALYRNDYILLKDKNVKVRNEKQAIETLYTHLLEKDVAVAGGKFVSGNLILNCGFIYDSDGIIYPACATSDISYNGYDDRMILSREVSMVDPAFCMIKKSVFNRLSGFKPNLTKRDSMLDFCLRARKYGFRTIFDPDVIVDYDEIMNKSNEESNKKLNALFSEGEFKNMIKDGDIYYNEYLPMGIQNYYF